MSTGLTTMRGCLAVALALAITTGGCKKEPAPAAPATESGGTKEATPAQGSAPAAPANGSPTATPSGSGASPSGETHKAAGTAAPLTLPAHVAAYGGIRGLDDFVKVATGVVDQVKPVPGLGLLLTAGISKTFGLSGGDWLDGSKPIRLAVANPGESRKPAVVALPLKSREAFERALPEEREARADGAAFKYKAGENDAWVAFSGDSVLLARDPAVLTLLKPFFEGPLASWRPDDAFEVSLSVANLTTMFAPELAKARTRITEKMTSRASRSPIPGTAEWIREVIDWTFGAIGELDTVSFGVRTDGDHVMLPITLHPKRGAALEATFAAARDRSVTLLDCAPSATWLALGSSFDPHAGAGWMEGAAKLLAVAMNVDETRAARLGELFGTASILRTGETALFLSRDGSMSFAALYVGGTQDGAKQRDATLGGLGLLWDRAMELAAEKRGPIPSGIDLTSFKTAVATIGPLLANIGIEVTLGSEPHTAGPVDFVKVRLDYDKLPVAKDDPEATQVVKSILGDTLTFATGFGKERYAFAVGPEATARVGAVIDGKQTQPPALRAALTRTASGASFVLWLSLVDALRAFSPLPELANQRALIATMTGSDGSAFSVGSAPGGALSVVFDVSMPMLRQVMKLR